MPRTITAVATAAALLAPLSASAALSTPAPGQPWQQAPAGAPGPIGVGSSAGIDPRSAAPLTDDDASDLARRALTEAALTAREVQQHSSATNGARDQRYGIGPRAAMHTMVQDGAVGISVRIDTPHWSYSDASGARSLTDETTATPSDRFRVASITKMMVATLVLQEVENGTLALDTPMEQILPGLFPENPDVTVEHLLTHTSGAPSGTDILLSSRMQDPADFEEFFQVLGEEFEDSEHIAAANVGWVHEPGAGFTYSNSGYVALGMLLEEVTGTPVSQLVQERIFDPLDMDASEYPDTPGAAGPWLVDTAYIGETDQPWRDLAHFDPSVFSHAGNAISTTADLTAFLDGLIGGELLSDDSLQTMITPPEPDLGGGYALGIYRLPDPCAAPGEEAWLYGHDGASFGTLSFLLGSPDGERSISLGVTGRNISLDEDALYDLTELLVPMMISSC